MIIGYPSHPVLPRLESLPWDCHLIGSRYVGVHDENSDYDFLLVMKCGRGKTDWVEERDAIHAALVKIDFTHMSGCGGYGPDPNLVALYTAKTDGFPPVDVLVADPAEAKMRLKFFEVQRKQGHQSGGKLAKALKAEKAWPTLWNILRSLTLPVPKTEAK